MTDDELRAYLKPRGHWKEAIALLIAVAGSVWAGTQWLHSRADEGEVREMRKDSFQTRLDMETMKGDMKAMNIRIDQGFNELHGQLNSMSGKRNGR